MVLDLKGLDEKTFEGQVLWVNRQDLSQMGLAYDMLALLRVFDEAALSEYFYHDKVDGRWQKKFY